MEDTRNIPKKIINKQISRSLRVIYDVKSYFERNGLIIDKEIRDVYVASIPKAVVTSQVSDIIDKLSSVNFNDGM